MFNQFIIKILITVMTLIISSTAISGPKSYNSTNSSGDSEVKCTPFNLRKSGYSMANVKVSNQGDLSTCYAHTTVKRVEALLKSTKSVSSDFQSSVLDFYTSYKAVNYVNEVRGTQASDLYDWGVMPCVEFALAFKNGLCAKSLLESNKEFKSVPKDQSDSEAIKIILRSIESHLEPDEIHVDRESQQDHSRLGKKTNEKNAENLSLAPTRENLKILRDRIDELNNQLKASEDPFQDIALFGEIDRLEKEQKLLLIRVSLYEDHISSCASGSQAISGAFVKLQDDIKRIMGESEVQGKPEDLAGKAKFKLMIVKKWVDFKCNGKRKFSSVAPSCREEGPDKFRERLNEVAALGKKALPIEITHKMGVLIPWSASPNGLHSSLVVGQYEKEGECFIQIQNSWGSDCRGKYDGALECKDGIIDVPATELMRSIVSFSTVTYR